MTYEKGVSSGAVVVREEDLALEEWPPLPYVTWTPEAFKKRLALAGFDFARPWFEIRDHEGRRWEQRELDKARSVVRGTGNTLQSRSNPKPKEESGASD